MITMSSRRTVLRFDIHFAHTKHSANDYSADLKERHVNMMAFSACIGFGLFLNSGKAIYIAGPGLAIVAMLLACSVMWAVVACLGEMTALFPVQGPLFEFPGRFLDEAVGYATGWVCFSDFKLYSWLT